MSDPYAGIATVAAAPVAPDQNGYYHLPAGENWDTFDPSTKGLPDGAYLNPSTGEIRNYLSVGSDAPNGSNPPPSGAPAADPYAGFSVVDPNSDPRMSGAEDIGRSLVSGLQQGVTGLAGLPGDLTAGGTKLLGHSGIDALSALGIVSDPDALKQRYDSSAAQVQPLTMFPVMSGQLNTADQSMFGPYHQPQTLGGRFANTAAQLAPTALAPGSLLLRGGRVLSSALGSTAAGELSGQNPWAKLAGAVAGGSVPGIAGGILAAPEQLVGSAAGNLSADQMNAAQALRVAAAQRGINLTVPEAVQQVTNNGTGLGRLQRLLEGTRQGSQQTAPYFAQRPAQVRGAVLDLADQIAPPTDQPSMIGVQAQKAAQGGLDRTRQTINLAAKSDYDALQGQEMDPDQYADVAADPSYKGALADIRGNPELNGPLAKLPDHNLAVVNEVVKRLRTNATAAQQTVMNPAGDNHLAGIRTGAASLADDLARDASPNYGGARDTVARLSGQYLDPLQAGPVGQIAATTAVPDQTAALFPKNPLEGAAPETSRAVGILGPVAPDLARQHLVNAFNQAGRDLQGGPNQYAGAKFAASIAGNPEQQGVLNAGMSALPNGDSVAPSLSDLLDVLRATGRRQPPGSMTAFNDADLAKLHGQNIRETGETLFNPLEWGKALGDMASSWQYKRNIGGILNMMMADPDQTAGVLQLARQRAATQGILGSLAPAATAPRQ